MDKNYWLKAWEDNSTPFHETQPNRYLTKFFAQLQPITTVVFVPLCGKSLDILWLQQQQHCKVVGVEISKLAVESFWRECNITPTLHQQGAYTHYCSEQCDILLGDFFKLSENDIGEISTVYDRASLIALPTDLRIEYAKMIQGFLKKGAKMLLIVVEYENTTIDTPPFSLTQQDITSLYGDTFTISLLAKEKVSTTPRWEEKGIHELYECAYFLEKM
ncbi:MAG: thiopurine S-methyltransferase [Gammaproteobacteria bacterium]